MYMLYFLYDRAANFLYDRAGTVWPPKLWVWSSWYFLFPCVQLLVKGTVFARMAPDQKAQLVTDLQTLGYGCMLWGMV